MMQARGVHSVVEPAGAVLLDTVRGVMFDVNHVGAFVWCELNGRTAEELVALVQTRFPSAAADAVRADVIGFLDRLSHRQLVQP